VLSTRARKEVALADVKVQVCVFAFDCLYHNGASLLHEPLTKRREVLHSSLKEAPGQVNLATTKISNDVEELEVSGGHQLENLFPSLCTCCLALQSCVPELIVFRTVPGLVGLQCMHVLAAVVEPIAVPIMCIQ
jgi:hypothetical protein